MAYKKLSETTLVESIVEETNILVEENDEIKRVPVSKMGFGADGSGGGAIFIDDFEKTPENALKLKAMFESGTLLARRDKRGGELKGVGLVVAVRQEYDDATGDDSVVFMYYGYTGDTVDDWWAID